METRIIILFFICICSLLNSIFSRFRSSTKLPPGPHPIPILTNLQWLRKSPLQIESLFRSFVAKYGPIFTLPMGTRPVIFIADRSIAHKALTALSSPTLSVLVGCRTSFVARPRHPRSVKQVCHCRNSPSHVSHGCSSRRRLVTVAQLPELRILEGKMLVICGFLNWGLGIPKIFLGLCVDCCFDLEDWKQFRVKPRFT
ncbi:unnamed protein product, partial [Citrullus colocynthis]